MSDIDTSAGQRSPQSGRLAFLHRSGRRRAPLFHGVAESLVEPDTALRLFGKPEVRGRRRVGVALARGDSILQAKEKARRVAERIRIELMPG